MKMTFISMNLMMLISPFFSHPISLGSMLFIQSIFASLMTLMMTKNSWFSFILFITFTGGLMIMFIYMSSIASNEKFKFSYKLLFMNMTLMMTYLYFTDLNLLLTNKWMEESLFFQPNEEKLSILKFLSSNKKIFSFIMILIILLTLIAVTNIVNSFEGPLKKTYENILT
nr:NADH dehydrogenase subunit 6 [Cixiini sp.]